MSSVSAEHIVLPDSTMPAQRSNAAAFFQARATIESSASQSLPANLAPPRGSSLHPSVGFEINGHLGNTVSDVQGDSVAPTVEPNPGTSSMATETPTRNSEGKLICSEPKCKHRVFDQDADWRYAKVKSSVLRESTIDQVTGNTSIRITDAFYRVVTRDLLPKAN
jgi:hypothetical protein